MPLEIIRNDITKMDVDAIVNAANTSLQMGGGVCGAIFAAAGAEALQAECDSIGWCEVGEAVITGGYNLPARYIIHTPGPIWRGDAGEEALLRNCYANSLALAKKQGCKSVAFPLISSGIYGYPVDKALHVAVSAIGEFLLDNEMSVYLAVYHREAYLSGLKLFTHIEKFIDDNYVDVHGSSSRRLLDVESRQINAMCDFLQPCAAAPMAAPAKAGKRSLEDVVNRPEESFSHMLLRLIDEKGMTDVQVYKRANIDRKLFSKIRGGKGYNPGKPTAVALSIALELNLDELLDLLGRAGFTLSHSSKSDLIIEYFVTEGVYNIHEINEALFAFDQGLLGA